MKHIPIMFVFFALVISGCASVPLAHKAESDSAKAFNPPTQG
jgi:starvation-inducible outer membrane lipoprotein